jgi:hypothetical protein
LGSFMVPDPEAGIKGLAVNGRNWGVNGCNWGIDKAGAVQYNGATKQGAIRALSDRSGGKRKSFSGAAESGPGVGQVLAFGFLFRDSVLLGPSVLG